ncbi:MAG: protein kinase [Planctomycetes bacterium]|nr:protein kinase [Planctomycetota bacterium]
MTAPSSERPSTPTGVGDDALFGRTLVREGVLTPEQLQATVQTQKTMRAQGVNLRLGELLVRQGHLTPEQVKQFLHLSGKQILHCPKCGKNYNVKNWKPDREVFCPTCSAGLVPPQSDRTIDAHSTHATLPAVREDVRDSAGKPFGRYRLIEELGHGGMGIVWKAWDTDLKRVVALKQILGEAAADAEQLERFVREARAAARLRHPNIVAVHDVGNCDGHPYFTTDYVAGQSLDKLMKMKPLPAKQALGLVKAVAEALQYAHDEGIFHRDVKPGNILVDGRGRPFVMDFGLAKEVDRGPGRKGLTISGSLMGTPLYMSPEQASGEISKQGPASDQFSLGVVLYELLTRRVPFQGRSMRELLNAITEQDPARPTRIAPRVHRDLETVCLRAMEKDPVRRYASIGDMAADIGRYLEGEPIAARPISGAERMWRFVVRNRTFAIPSAAAVVCLAAFGIYAFAGRAERSRKLETALSSAKELRSQDKPDDALKAYQSALAYDESSPEAKEGLAWAEGELKRRREASEAARGRAQTSLRKSGLVQEVLGRWMGLAPALESLEGIYYDTSSNPAENRARAEALWKPVREFIDETPGDATSQATMKALAGWAHRLSGEEARGLAWMKESRSLDTDLPYGALLEALVLFSGYLRAQEMPEVMFSSSGPVLGDPPAETKALAETRRRMESLLLEAEKAPVWGEGLAQDFRKAIQAMQSMQAGRYAEAESGFSGLLGRPALRVFRTDLLFARSSVRFLVGHFEDSRDDLEMVRGVRPKQAEVLHFLGENRIALAMKKTTAGGDPKEEYEAAIRAFDEAAGLKRDYLSPILNRGVAYIAWAEFEADRGRDARDLYRKAHADAETGIQFRPDYLPSWVNRAVALEGIAEANAARGEDVRAMHDRAIADYDEILRRRPDWVPVASNRGHAWVRKAEQELARGGDPLGAIGKALADYDHVVALDARTAVYRRSRAAAYALRARIEAVRKGDVLVWFEKAGQELDEAERLEKGSFLNSVFRGKVMYERAEAELALGRETRGSLEGAVAAFSEALKQQSDYVSALLGRALARARLGEAAVKVSLDAGGVLVEAIADADAVLRLVPRNPEALNLRGAAWMKKGEQEARRAADPSDSFKHAVSDYEALVKDNPRFAAARANYGRMLALLGEWAKAVEEIETALKLDPRADTPSLREALEEARSGAAHPWLATLSRARQALMRNDYAAAGPLYEEAIRSAGAGAATDPRMRGYLCEAYYNLACVYSTFSTGRTSPDPKSPAKAISETDAALHRDAAFERLRLARECGFSDRANLLADPTLVPLHSDPRWKAYVDSLHP